MTTGQSNPAGLGYLGVFSVFGVPRSAGNYPVAPRPFTTNIRADKPPLADSDERNFQSCAPAPAAIHH
ncbi:hypothetical protein ACSSNL_00385 [Thalassobius sp. S69A]|uniref:hypothetical protein n=1 Tax=Thalassobius sp. S69A TaxID=3450125 RepID=UPI0040567D55